MNNSRAQDTLRLLCEVASDREHDLLQYSTSIREDSDNEADAETPNFYSFYSVGGNESELTMTNFTAPEFRKLYSILEPFVTTWWNNSRGKKTEFKPMYVFFMFLVVLKR